MAGLLALTGGWGPFALLAGTIAAAGLVRGFTGFGTALIFMPVAASVLDPAAAILVMVFTGMAVWPVLIPRAWGTANRGEVAAMGMAAILATPLGVALLTRVSEDAVRWALTAAATVTLAALVTGWRYRGEVGLPGKLGIGAAGGVLGGATGLAGPPVILFYLAGPESAARIRANTILFLCILDLSIAANLLVQTEIGGFGIWLGVALAVPYVLTTALGQRLFDPAREGAYRLAAYALIGAAIVLGLPVWR